MLALLLVLLTSCRHNARTTVLKQVKVIMTKFPLQSNTSSDRSSHLDFFNNCSVRAPFFGALVVARAPCRSRWASSACSFSGYLLEQSRRPAAILWIPLAAPLFQATVACFATSSLPLGERTGVTPAPITGGTASNPAHDDAVPPPSMFHRPGLASNVTPNQAISHICKATTLLAAPDRVRRARPDCGLAGTLPSQIGLLSTLISL